MKLTLFLDVDADAISRSDAEKVARVWVQRGAAPLGFRALGKGAVEVSRAVSLDDVMPTAKKMLRGEKP